MHREGELAVLDRTLASLDRQHLHALVTGLRQVGKSALTREFLRRKREEGVNGVFVRGGNVTGPDTFFRAVYEGLVDSVAGTDNAATQMGLVISSLASTRSQVLARLAGLYAQCWDGSADHIVAVQNAWRLPEMLGEELGRPVIAVLDEVHEVFHQLGRTGRFRSAGGASKVGWDARGQVQHARYGFWLFTTSIRTAGRTFFEGSRSPFYLQVHELRLASLGAAEALDLARALADPTAPPTHAALGEVARLSGGLPGILIHLLRGCPPHADRDAIRDVVTSSIRGGTIAALYNDITNDLTREGKQSTRMLLLAMHALARGEQSALEIGRRLGVSAQSASNLLATLGQLALTEAVGRKQRQFTYPLMREWLQSRPMPPIAAQVDDRVLRTQLGFGAEARVREALAALKKPVTLRDDAEGETLFGTADEITIGPFVRVRQRREEPETDAIGDERERTLVLSCRYRLDPTSGSDIRTFAEQQVAHARAAHPNVYAVYMAAAGFTLGAVAEARDRGVILVGLKGMNELTRAVGHNAFPPQGRM